VKKTCGNRWLVNLFGTTLLATALAASSPVLAQPASPPAGMQLPPITEIARPARPGEIPLYPGRVVKGPQEQWNTYLGGPIVRNVVTPTLTPMLPPAGKANGTAVIYAPGGGFYYLSMSDAEPQRLLDQGVTVFLLKYRTKVSNRDPKTFLTELYKFLFAAVAENQKTGAANTAPLHATPEALEDGLAAVRLVRSRAKEWNIDPTRIGFMGASAGAMTALDVSFTADAAARPDFIVAMISPKKIAAVPATAPPLFAASSVDDPLFPGSTENLVAAWARAGRPVEAHFYEKGGHGLPAGSTSDRWFDQLVLWMKSHGWIQSRP
jgi:acetyl esterase/lipase